jgi:uncharacterized protein (DUF302 family)
MKKRIKRFISKKFLGDIVEKKDIKAPMDLVMKKLEKSINDHSFSIAAIHDLDKTYKNKELPVDFEYKIVQICNAQKSHKALTSMSQDLGIMMPKSIVVSSKDGITSLRFMKMKPWMVSLMFPDIDIAPMSKNVTNIMRDIITQTIDETEKEL